MPTFLRTFVFGEKQIWNKFYADVSSLSHSIEVLEKSVSNFTFRFSSFFFN